MYACESHACSKHRGFIGVDDHGHSPFHVQRVSDDMVTAHMPNPNHMTAHYFDADLPAIFGAAVSRHVPMHLASQQPYKAYQHYGLAH